MQRYLIVLAMALLLLQPSFLTGAVVHITADTIWSGVVNVNEHLIVDPEVKLTIAAGTEVVFKSGSVHEFDSMDMGALTIRGRMIAQGMPAAVIKFRPDIPDANWGAIFFDNADSSLMKFCNITNGSYIHDSVNNIVIAGAVTIDSSIVKLENCRIEHNLKKGVSIVNSEAGVYSSLIAFNSESGISITGMTGTEFLKKQRIINCTIVNNLTGLSISDYNGLQNCDVVNTIIDLNELSCSFTDVPQDMVKFSSCLVKDEIPASALQNRCHVFNESMPLFKPRYLETVSFRPGSNSPVIEQGELPMDADSVEFDLTGNFRIENGRIDIGCHEFSGRPSVYLAWESIGYDNNYLWNADTVKVIPQYNMLNIDGKLDIAQGTRIIFDAQKGLMLTSMGRIRAMGSKDLPIFFTAKDTSGFFSANSAGVGWAGIEIGYGMDSSLLRYCVFEYVNYTENYTAGGALRLNMAKINIDRCLFRFNRAIETGGAIYSDNASPTITSCIFNYNSSGSYGGALCFRGGNPLIVNSLFHHNKSSLAGAIAFLSGYQAGASRIINCTIVDNIAMESFGALKYEGSGQTGGTVKNPEITNSIIYNNQPSSSPQIWLVDDYVDPDISNSLLENGLETISIDGTYTGKYTGNIQGNPRLINQFPFDYYLEPVSPCIDKGRILQLPSGMNDLAGSSRVSGLGIDIGCYEYKESPILPTFIPRPGFYSQPVSVFIENRNNSLTTDLIRYTTDGSDVNWSSPLYNNQPIPVGPGYHHFKAKIYFTVDAILDSSEMVEANYTIGGMSGNVSGVFKRALSPYFINSVLTIPANDSLIIEPGVEIIAKTNEAGMVVRGKLITLGERNNPVVFRSEQPFTGWKGLDFVKNSSSSILRYTMLKDGRAMTAADSAGGALYLLGGRVKLQNCFIVNNSAKSGGGIFMDSSSVLQADSCLIADNMVLGSGGGIYAANSELNLSRTHVAVNGQRPDNVFNSTGHGGGIFAKNSALQVERNSLLFNNCNGWGGGIYILQQSDQPTNVHNNNICSNEAASGGGGLRMVSAFSLSEVNLDNNTFNKNAAVKNLVLNQPGSAASFALYSPLTMRNLIVWDNRGLNSLHDANSKLTVNYSDVDYLVSSEPAIFPGTGNINQPPRFINIPAFYGINTAQATTNSFNNWLYNWHLHPASPCIDTGDPTQLPNNEPGLNNPVNMGSFGNTAQADLKPHHVEVTDNGDIYCLADTCYVLNINGKGVINTLNISSGSRVYLNSLADLTINSLSIAGGGDATCLNNYVESRGVQLIKVNYQLNASDADIQNLALECSNPSTVAFKNIKMNSDGASQVTALKITGGQNISLENSQFNSYPAGIAIDNRGYKSETVISLQNLEFYGNAQVLKNREKTIGIKAATHGSFTLENSTIADADTALVLVGSNNAILNSNEISFTGTMLDKVAYSIRDVTVLEADSNSINGVNGGIEMVNSSGRLVNNSIGYTGALSKSVVQFGIKADNCTNLELIGNIITDSSSVGSGSGIEMVNSSGRLVNNSIGYTGALSKSGKSGIVLADCSVDSLYHNSVVNAGTGLLISGNPDSVYVINNIFWKKNDTSSNQVIIGNDVFLYNNDISGNAFFADPPHHNNVNSDPGFASDSLVFDWELSDSLSLCVNGGKKISGYHIENYNYYGNAPDMGATESVFGAGTSGIELQQKNLIWDLCQNFPNPFNPVTTIKYTVPSGYQGIVKMRIYNMNGQVVAEPLNNYHCSGTYQLQFNGNSLSSGVYIYQLQGQGFNRVKRMLLLK